jgi:hypothetical protein
MRQSEEEKWSILLSETRMVVETSSRRVAFLEILAGRRISAPDITGPRFHSWRAPIWLQLIGCGRRAFQSTNGYQFRGLLSVHSRYDLQTRQVALCDPLHRRLRRLCCLQRRSDCFYEKVIKVKADVAALLCLISVFVAFGTSGPPSLRLLVLFLFFVAFATFPQKILR